MKLPSFSGRNKQQELFLTLLIYPDAVDAACWALGKQGEAIIEGAVTQELMNDSWEERIEAVDKCVSTLEDLTKSENINKVILGFPSEYLTEEGDVRKEIKPHIKELTKLLELTPIGFVSIYQAIIHQYKKLEGVPPSMILMGITIKGITVTLYKVGNFIGQRVFAKEGNLIGHLEDALSTFTDVEILPARILLYGTDRHTLEDAKRDILQYHWQQKANFLHFPKAEILPGDGAAAAVSHAGASELMESMDVENEELQVEEVEEVEEKNETARATTSVEEDINHPVDSASQTILDENEVISTEQETEKQVFEEELPIHEEEYDNIEPVTPEDIGFSTVDEEDVVNPARKPTKNKISQMFLSVTHSLKQVIQNVLKRRKSVNGNNPKKIKTIVIVVIPFLIALVGFILFSFVLPKATIAITVIPRTVEAEKTFIIEPNGSTNGDVVSGLEKEESVNGEKSVSVTGKKTIGDPAKGTITIFNKSQVPRTIKKGTVISAGSIDFLLDDDVSIASASESLAAGTITYGKANGNVTAKEIGTQGNISSGREFSISGISTSIATARNDQAFTGGTSKDITVVSRADQDNAVKQLTAELIEQAKNGFGISEGEQLISDTITSEVSERAFSHEIGQEAKELTVKATVVIKGTAYKEDDIKAAMNQALSAEMPDGYKLSQDSFQISTNEPIVEKSGEISISITGSAKLIPSFELKDLTSQIAGKSITEAESIIKNIQGVGGVAIKTSLSLFPNKLPSRQQNLSVSIEAQ